MSDLTSLRSAAQLSADKPHGTRIKYMGGCKCSDCRKANSRYECERAQMRKAGDWNGIVETAQVRAHLRRLQRAGLGRKSIAAASDVNAGTIRDIITGSRLRIRARSERRLLQVDTDARADRSYVKALRTWSLIRRLLDEGYTKTRLAKLLGYTSALQFNKEYVTARNALRVERLYERLTI
jgi:hypothetical protein